ncbi:MAG: hypothetical protein OIF36_05200 [Alphaproteobacteria bacterium]|nr:hypothetical protein [Alphaproteobacteria bacterium]
MKKNNQKKINFIKTALERLRSKDLDDRSKRIIKYNKKNMKNDINKFLNNLRSEHPEIKDPFIYVKIAINMLRIGQLSERWYEITQDIEKKFEKNKNKNFNKYFNYFKWAQTKLKESDLCLYNKSCKLPKESVKKLNNAMNNLSSEVTYLINNKDIDLKQVFLTNLTDMLEEDKAYKTIKNIPHFMRLKLERNIHTDAKSLEEYRNEFNKKALKPLLLIHIAKNSSILEDVYGIKLSDIHLNYRLRLKSVDCYDSKYDSKEYKLSNEASRIMRERFTIDHISEISAFGSKSNGKIKVFDNIFQQKLHTVNLSDNLCIIDKELNFQKEEIKKAQSQSISSTHFLFLNLVPTEDPAKNNFFANHNVKLDESRRPSVKIKSVQKIKNRKIKVNQQTMQVC